LLTYLGHKNSAKIEDLLRAFTGKGKNNQSIDSNLAETAAVLQQFLDLGIIKVCQIDASTEAIADRGTFHLSGFLLLCMFELG
jgi:hypothetical protein